MDIRHEWIQHCNWCLSLPSQHNSIFPLPILRTCHTIYLDMRRPTNEWVFLQNQERLGLLCNDNVDIRRVKGRLIPPHLLHQMVHRGKDHDCGHYHEKASTYRADDSVLPFLLVFSSFRPLLIYHPSSPFSPLSSFKKNYISKNQFYYIRRRTIVHRGNLPNFSR